LACSFSPARLRPQRQVSTACGGLEAFRERSSMLPGQATPRALEGIHPELWRPAVADPFCHLSGHSPAGLRRRLYAGFGEPFEDFLLGHGADLHGRHLAVLEQHHGRVAADAVA